MPPRLPIQLDCFSRKYVCVNIWIRKQTMKYQVFLLNLIWFYGGHMARFVAAILAFKCSVWSICTGTWPHYVLSQSIFVIMPFTMNCLRAPLSWNLKKTKWETGALSENKKVHLTLQMYIFSAQTVSLA